MKSFLADLILPRFCVVCGRDLDCSEECICGGCLADLPLTRLSEQSRNPIADRLNALIENGPYLYATSLFYYRTDYRHITPALKYGRNFAAGRYFAGMLGKELSLSPLFKDVDCIIPVPLHWFRRWRRGYNQAEIIARGILPFLESAAVRTDVLVRRRHTASQTKKKGTQKRSNVSGAFAAHPFKTVPKHILLVDDVFTSGNTSAACIEALKKVLPKGSTRISVATLAYAGE